MKCPRCQAENRDGARFCRECGNMGVLVNAPKPGLGAS